MRSGSGRGRKRSGQVNPPPESVAVSPVTSGLQTIAPRFLCQLYYCPNQSTEVGPCLSSERIWDRIAAGDTRGRELLERKLAVNLARAPFHLTAVDGDGGPFRLRYRPPDLRAALWQRLAGEAAGLIRCVRCPAPSCARWFLAGVASRSDRQFCSDRCRVRAFRGNIKTHSALNGISALRT
jgi:hypothetical protein